MVNIPTEIVKIIIDELAKHKEPRSEEKLDAAWRRGTTFAPNRTTALARYAVISKAWQWPVESYTFKFLEVTSQELGSIREVIRKRQHLISRLHYEVILPNYDIASSWPIGSREKDQTESKVFSEAVKELFKELSSWSTTATQHNGLQLHLACHSPSDRTWRSRWADYNWVQADLSTEVGSHNQHFHFLDQHREAIRNVRIVMRLTHDYQLRRPLDPVSFCTLASYLPNLQHFEVVAKDDFANLADRKQIREGKVSTRDFLYNVSAYLEIAFATALALLPVSLQVFSIRYAGSGSVPKDERGPAPCLVSPDGVDYFSSCVRTMSQRLTALHVCCVISLDLFRPSELDEKQNAQPFWPNLKVFSITLPSVLADGQWLFEEDPTYPGDSNSGEEEDLDPEAAVERGPTYHFRPLAAAQMPKLEKLHMTLEALHHDVLYHIFSFGDDGKNRYIRWKTCPGYEPSARVIEAWRVAKGDKIEIEIIPKRAHWQGSQWQEEYW